MQFQNFKRFTRRVLSTVDDDGVMVWCDLFINLVSTFCLSARLVRDYSYKSSAKTVCRYEKQTIIDAGCFVWTFSECWHSSNAIGGSFFIALWEQGKTCDAVIPSSVSPTDVCCQFLFEAFASLHPTNQIQGNDRICWPHLSNSSHRIAWYSTVVFIDSHHVQYSLNTQQATSTKWGKFFFVPMVFIKNCHHCSFLLPVWAVSPQ